VSWCTTPAAVLGEVLRPDDRRASVPASRIPKKEICASWTKDIRDSVGDAKKGAVNRDDDVKTVQGLLNVQIVTDRRSDRFISVDGR
jgi:hypothetical protein